MENKATLSDFFKLLSENTPAPIEGQDNANDIEEPSQPKITFEDFFKEAGLSKVEITNIEIPTKPPIKSLAEEHDDVLPELMEQSWGLFGGDPTVKTEDPLTPLYRDFVTQRQLQDHYKTFIGRVQQQLSSIGGGGETKLRRLDDIDRSTIGDNRFLKYDASSGNFIFAPVVIEEISTSITFETTLVTQSSYTAIEDDHYIGVDYNGACDITLPVSPRNGTSLVIKDESGNSSNNLIRVLGDVDNDPAGFTIRIDNGSISLIYRDGWRII